MCDDGLVFDPSKRSNHKCDHMHNVDCEDRTELRKSLTCNFNQSRESVVLS